MVEATRGTPEDFQPDQAGSSQHPPPALPNLAEVMAQQTELLNQLVQAQMGQFHHQSRGHDEHPSANYQDFLSTQPPLFHKVDEPLDADAWLRTIEPKMRTRPSSQPNNFAALPAYGGTITMPCSRLVMSSPGMNSGLFLEHITFQRDSLSESLMNF
jgi:hypothetical protein